MEGSKRKSNVTFSWPRVGWLVKDWSVGQSVGGRSVGQLVGWLVGRSGKAFVVQSTCRTLLAYLALFSFV